MAFTSQTGRPTADRVSTGVDGTVNSRPQVTDVAYRNPDFGKGNEDTLTEDILNLKAELLALMQMAMGVCWGQGWVTSVDCPFQHYKSSEPLTHE